MNLHLAATAVFLVMPTLCFAASSDWHRVEGGAVRLVTSSQPESDGTLRGALQIELEPGWKTYWQDPGSSGVPPTIEASVDGRTVPVSLSFPEPEWFEDEYSSYAGYSHSVTFAVTFDMPPPVGLTPLKADVFLGICETICVPVSAALSVEQAVSTSDASASVVESAFEALPPKASETFQARILRVQPDALTVEAIVPEGAVLQSIFVAGTHDTTVGTPAPLHGSQNPTFAIPLYGKIKTGDVLDYTVVSSSGSVRGQLEIP